MNNKEKAREFCLEVKKLAKKYDLPFFVVTDGASLTSNNNCSAVKNARDAHIKWEKENGYDPFEDWGKEKQKVRLDEKEKTSCIVFLYRSYKNDYR